MTQQERTQAPRRPAAGPARAQMVVIVGFVVIVAIGLAVFFMRSGARSDIAGATRADLGSPAMVAEGRQLYQTRCAGCHGASGEGQPGWQQRGPNGLLPAPPIDASGPSPQRSDARLFAVIKQGGQVALEPGALSGMPSFGSALSDAEIWALISYMKSTWPAQLQTAQPAQ